MLYVVAVVCVLLGALILLFLYVPGGGSQCAHACRRLFRGGRRRRAIGTKSEQRFDATLFCYIMLNVLGSAVWLRLIPSGDRFGRGMTYPLWVDELPAQYRPKNQLVPKVDGFRMAVHTSTCNYTTDADKPDFCGSTSPQVLVSATIDHIEGVMQGLIFTVHSSNNFDFWMQGNAVQLPRDMVTSADPLTFDTATIENFGLQRAAVFSRTNATANASYAVTTSACLGTPGHYYLVGCLRQGVPPKLGLDRPMCTEPPCAGGIGPPFSSCLAIATACVTTCDSLSVETRVPPICEDGQVPHSEIEKYSRPFGYLDAAFVAFLICYTVGLMYFFVMCEQTCAT